MKNRKESKVIFDVTEEEVQFEALRYLGRRLTESELDLASKSMYDGLATTIDIVFRAAILNSVDYYLNLPKT